MTTNYAPIAVLYKRAKQQPWRTHIEAFTLMRVIGDPTGKTVIDIACGEGFYTRMIRQRGAAKVTGVDLSEKMIELARASEAQWRFGVDYIVGDGRDLAVASGYDLAVATYFLNYAHLRGGRFVTVNCNPACDFPAALSYRKYGFETSVVAGSPICLWTWLLVCAVVSSTADLYRLCSRGVMTT